MEYVPFIVMVVLFVAVFFFFLIRPMRQREKQHDQMVLKMEKGDVVITAGGVYGEVEKIDDDSVIHVVSFVDHNCNNNVLS